MQTTPLTLNHQPLITKLCHELNLSISEYNFCNLFLFRQTHSYFLHTLQNDTYAIKGVSYQNHSFFMPLFRPHNWDEMISLAKSTHAQYIYPIPQMWWEEIKALGYTIEINDDESDYIYDTKSIQICRGRHLSNHRNAVRQFLDSYTIKAQAYDESLYEKTLDIIHAWQEEKNKQADIQALIKGIKNAATLNLQGWIFHVNNEPAGCLFGQPLCQNCYLFHFSKALSKYRGLARYMRQYCAQQISLPFLNWEQDLGIPGLRQFKRSYRPCKMLQKGRLLL